MVAERIEDMTVEDVSDVILETLEILLFFAAYIYLYKYPACIFGNTGTLTPLL